VVDMGDDGEISDAAEVCHARGRLAGVGLEAKRVMRQSRHRLGTA
jgi:hypothetical protein